MPEPAHVCVLGSINMDITVRTPRFPEPGQTLLGGPLMTSPGGKGANQAVAASRAGAAVAFIGCVGSDAYGHEMRAVLAAENINLDAVATVESVATGVAVITVDDAGENTIVVAPGANAHADPLLVSRATAIIARSSWLLMQLEVPIEAVHAAAQIAQRHGVRVALNAAPARRLPAELLASIDTLIVNTGEARLIAGCEAEEPELARRLLALGPSEVIITLGARGALHADRERIEHQQPHKVRAVDTVGAGDTFCGHWVAARSAQLAPRACLARAAVAGALATTRRGAIPSIPTHADVDAALGHTANNH